jgi:hypothetical protein
MARPTGFAVCAASSSQEDARRVPLFRFGLHCGERFRYEYDFTADWALDIRLEKALPFNQDRALPLCIGGSRAAPPEDCASKGSSIAKPAAPGVTSPPYGLKVSLFLTRLHARLLRPGFAALESENPCSIPHPLRAALHRVDQEIQHMLENARLLAKAA